MPAPKIFTSYEIKLLAALMVLAFALLWSLTRQGSSEGLFGVALIGGLAIYLSYAKYYRTCRPAMDRWGIRELCHHRHPRQEYRVACRDLEISADEVQLIGRQHGVKVVSNSSAENPDVQIYTLQDHYARRPIAKHIRLEKTE